MHTFSGDAIQFDPGRNAPGWDDIAIDGCRLWLAPLAADANGFSAGTVPGENAIDTKTPVGATATIVVRDTTAFGFRGGLISNMAAFNMKEGIDARFDRVTVYDSEIAFRLRAPARVRVQNAIVHDVDTAVRYEDDITAPAGARPTRRPRPHVLEAVGPRPHAVEGRGPGLGMTGRARMVPRTRTA